MKYLTIETLLHHMISNYIEHNPHTNDMKPLAELQVKFLKHATVTAPAINEDNGIIFDTMSVLPLADFTIFNETYGTAEHDSCTTCSASGGFITPELQGDEHMTGWVNTFDSCQDCIGSELCPGCMQPLSLSFDLSAFEATTTWVTYDNPSYATNLGYLKRSFDYEDVLSVIPFEGFTCLCCGWQYDPDRHYDREDDYYDDSEVDY